MRAPLDEARMKRALEFIKAARLDFAAFVAALEIEGDESMLRLAARELVSTPNRVDKSLAILINTELSHRQKETPRG